MFLATGVGAFAAGIFHLMTHAFFKALLFLGSGSVIHAMAGEQDMQRMGGLKTYMPVTFMTMMIGTLAIAGIPPLAGFFSKDEILYRTFLENRALWALAVVTALMTAFYMFRLMSLTFFGGYRGPAWSRAASPAAAAEAAGHGAVHPRDAHAHGHAHKDDHDVTHGAADVLAHGHGWHGPHESPRMMTVPLMALAVGAMVAGFIGIPQALRGTNAIEHFLEPSFTAPAADRPADDGSHGVSARQGESDSVGQTHQAEGHGVELALMLLSVLVAAGGILFARHLYVNNPAVPARLAARWPGAHALLFNKYYVDELYDATVIRGTTSSARRLWGFDRVVVDGGVNGSGLVTRLAAWFSHMADKYVVDGAVNLVGWSAGEGSLFVRRLQTGLVQNYALLMVVGVFLFLTIYLIAR
jgi:NADH-quinone oxidoreductase subunit L